jgi:hypothetical protein
MTVLGLRPDRQWAYQRVFLEFPTAGHWGSQATILAASQISTATPLLLIG